MNVSQNPVYKVLHLGCTLRLYPCPKEKKKKNEKKSRDTAIITNTKVFDIYDFREQCF